MNGQNLTKCSNFGGIPPLTSELAATECLKKSIYKLVSNLAPSFCKLVRSSPFLQVHCTKDIYIVSKEFEIWPDPTMDCGDTCL